MSPAHEIALKMISRPVRVKRRAGLVLAISVYPCFAQTEKPWLRPMYYC